jgi:hypothetical protein
MPFALLEVVMLLNALPDRQLIAGQVGTIVERLDAQTVLVEFADNSGVPLAILPVPLSALASLPASA